MTLGGGACVTPVRLGNMGVPVRYGTFLGQGLLSKTAETLLQKEKLTGEMFAQLMENGKLDEPEAPAAETQTAADTAPVPAPEGGDAPAAEAANAPADPAPDAPKSDR